VNGDKSVGKSHARPINAALREIVDSDVHHSRVRF